MFSLYNGAMRGPLRATIFAVVLVGATSIDARAQDTPVDSASEARQRYQEGTKAFQTKHYADAALHFEAAASFKANAVALYTAALAWDLALKPERAADAYARALEVGGLETKQANIAQRRVAALEKTLGTVTVTSSDSGCRVQVDDLTEVAAPARLHAPPGVHVLGIRIPNKPVEHRDLTLEVGKTMTIELKSEPEIVPTHEPEVVPERKPEPPPPPPVVAPIYEDPMWTTVRVVGIGVAAVGVATLGAATIFATSANGAKDAYEAAPSRAGYDHASSLETWTNVSLIAGAVLVAGGIALVALPIGGRSQTRAKVGATLGSLVVRGAF